MIKKNAIYLLLILAVLVSLSVVFYVNTKLDKIVVVDVIKVFNQFNMKKQLEEKVDIELNKYTEHIDSMKSLLQMAQERNDEKRIEIFSKEIYLTESEGQRAFEISNKNINEQVWNRLNPLIDEFAKKGKYRIVIGANGMGTVLYNVDAVDRTQELINYINERYETGN